jgi:uncharacterized protein with HEPN domain
MRPETVSLLDDVRRAAETCLRFAAGKSYEDYTEDELLRSGIERQLTIIGEALYVIRREDAPVVASLTDPHGVIALRHILVHAYSAVNNETVLDLVTEKLPILLGEVETLLAEARGS